jgi:hypothetical protein
VIEVASWPPDHARWYPATEPFYLELFGETAPVLDTALAEVLPARKADPQTSSSSAQFMSTDGPSATLTPVHQQQAWWTQVGQDLKLLQPLVAGAGSIAGLVPGGATASKWLERSASCRSGASRNPRSSRGAWRR